MEHQGSESDKTEDTPKFHQLSVVDYTPYYLCSSELNMEANFEMSLLGVIEELEYLGLPVRFVVEYGVPISPVSISVPSLKVEQEEEMEMEEVGSDDSNSDRDGFNNSI